MPKLTMKEGVGLELRHLAGVEVLTIFAAALRTAPPTSDGLVVVTSLNDSTHMKGSLHYEFDAVDLRIRNITGDVNSGAQAWVSRLKATLGNLYDVKLEADHIHVEFDPE